MNIAESTVMNAIRHSMGKNGFANIVLAGPIASGKREMANLIENWFHIINSIKCVSVFSEEDYLKESNLLSDNKFGVKDIDLKESFDLELYFQDAKYFLDKEHDKKEHEFERIIRRAKRNSEGKVSYIYGISTKGKINIFTGPHAIELMRCGEVDVPKPIFIFLNADLQKCIQKRAEKGFMIPKFPIGSHEWEDYFEYIINQNEKHVLPQMKMADIIIKCD